ncbi:MAG: undecaprenyldiphospho-muramoylpentapeptide beta-N-acetylglucosaminyltransferase [Clostridia bacterium]|nr:undecaprenyldiphospho-muramoylpentapeptide beta-N-acetylglucosaminyltransferase [Clostridia bacterium]
MRVLLCGGGTAGHVMPAIAIGEIIEKNFPGATIAFAGREGGGENEAYSKTKHRLYTIDIKGLSRSISLNNAKTFFKLIKSGRNARSIISNFNPDIIIGTGGYVCYPFIRQGQRMKIKTVIHESNVSPGLVTRLLGGRCDQLLLNLEGTKSYLRKTSNISVVGNPTRSGFSAITKSEARQRLRIPDGQKLILSFGGSLGAEMINEAVIGFMYRYASNNKSIYHIHATGKIYFEKVKDKYPELFEKWRNIKVVPYIDDMPLFLSAADLAITRSGAMTVSELLRCGTPSILIPSPNVTANHQYVNADYMQKIGASILIEEKDMSVERLRNEIMSLISDPSRIKHMSECARAASPTDTELLTVNAIKKLTIR